MKKIINYFKKINMKDNSKKLSKPDWIIMGIMVLVYGIISFIRLGDTKAPSTFKEFNDNSEIVVTLKDETFIGMMRYYVGYELGEIKVLTSTDNEQYNEATTIHIGGVFYWGDIDINQDAKYVKFVGSSRVTLGDVAFYNNYGEKIPIVVEKDNPLTDEIDLVPDEISYMNSTYFDEIYYARSSYEYAHGMDAYEWSHPPLSKLLMTIPVVLFGFNPFTWRLMTNIVGILLIPAMYILGKKIFKNRKWALLAGLIMMFDTFHFAHTRIALGDGYQILFIILSTIFMIDYLDLGKKDKFSKKVKYLLLSGTFMGCALATKWNAAYFCLGLAITFFVHLAREYNIHPIKKLKKYISVSKIVTLVGAFVVVPLILFYLVYLIINKDVSKIIVIIYYVVSILWLLVMLVEYLIRNKKISQFFKSIFKDKYLFKLAGICIVSFIIVPVIIYVLCYILVPTVSYYDGTLGGIIDVNKMMYEYHSNLDATHPFSSVWYEWPIMRNPVWFYSGATKSGLRMTISDIGNPAIWWMGILSFVYLVISAFKKRDKDHILLLIFILSTFIPYVFIGRLMFMYHYFITLPFIMLGIVAFIKWITEKTNNNKTYYGYIFLIIFMFIIFYPIVSALPVSNDYIESLKWLPHWYF